MVVTCNKIHPYYVGLCRVKLLDQLFVLFVLICDSLELELACVKLQSFLLLFIYFSLLPYSILGFTSTSEKVRL